MSRSYKHSPQCGNSKTYGRYRAKRRNRCYNKDLKNPSLNYSLYKKNYPQLEISDYNSYCDFNEYYKRRIEFWHWQELHNFKNKEPYPTREKAYNKWYKCYKRK